MKKVINGKVYDTDKASEIGSTSGGAEQSTDLHYWEEVLYKKRTGEYFLYCFGGALSHYGIRKGRSCGSGEHIKPLSYDKAKEWAEKALSGDKWIEEFGEPEESTERHTLNISITAGAVEIVKRAAQKAGKSVSEMIETLIREKLA